MVNGKPWSVSAALRGFYDTNPNTAPDGSPDKFDTFGFTISPSINVMLPMEQTTIRARYTYTGTYYDKEVGTAGFSQTHWDNSHEFEGSLDHNFSERYSVAIMDSFVIGQEPDQLGYSVLNTPQRISGNNVRNYGSIRFDATLTDLMSVEIGYDNQYLNYDDSGGFIAPDGPGGTFIVVRPGTEGDVGGASLSGLLDRIEHMPHLEFRFHTDPQTYFALGYKYDQTVYTGDEPIGVNPADASDFVTSSIRDSRSHIGYVGINHNFNPEFVVNAQVGAQSFDAYNDPNSSSEITPWANASMSYTYAPQSAVSTGFTYQRSATDEANAVFTPAGLASLTTDANYATFYVTLHHRILADLFANLTGTYQHSVQNNGVFDGQSENFFLAGFDLSYHFNQFISADAGYNYDRLDSDSSANPSYKRSRVYVGLTASY